MFIYNLIDPVIELTLLAELLHLILISFFYSSVHHPIDLIKVLVVNAKIINKNDRYQKDRGDYRQNAVIMANNRQYSYSVVFKKKPKKLDAFD